MPPMYGVIATAGRGALLKRTLQSLAECQKPSSYKKTIVVENGAKGPVEGIIQGLTDPLSIEYLYFPEGNKSKALNYALQHIPNGLVVFFDDDIRLHPSVLERYAEAIQDTNKKQFYGGPVDVDYEEAPADWLIPFLPGSARGWGLDGLESENHPWFLGSNWAAFHANLISVGGFNPSIGPGSLTGSLSDETDIQQRLVKAGFEKVFVPNALVHHYVPHKRCTLTWMLHRGYRMGITIGLDNDKKNRPLMGIPRWWYVALFKRLAKLPMTAIWGRKSERFETALALCRHFGILSGYWHSSNFPK